MSSLSMLSLSRRRLSLGGGCSYGKRASVPGSRLPILIVCKNDAIDVAVLK